MIVITAILCGQGMGSGAALRTVGRLWALQGEPILADVRALAEAAESV